MNSWPVHAMRCSAPTGHRRCPSRNGESAFWPADRPAKEKRPGRSGLWDWTVGMRLLAAVAATATTPVAAIAAAPVATPAAAATAPVAAPATTTTAAIATTTSATATTPERTGWALFAQRGNIDRQAAAVPLMT